MWTVHLNQKATRRLRFHYIYDDRGHLRWTTKHADDVFDFLAEHGPDEFQIRTGTRVTVLRWVDRSPIADHPRAAVGDQTEP